MLPSLNRLTSLGLLPSGAAGLGALAALAALATLPAACGSSSTPPASALGDDAGGGASAGDAMLPDGRDAADSVDGSSACSPTGASWTDPGVAAPTPDPAAAGKVHRFFKITVLDKSSAPVVGATLTTTNATVYTTDRNGNVAYYEPGLMGTDVWLSPACAGYSYPADGLGNAGTALHPTEGGSATVTMTKTGAITAPAAGDLQTRLLAGAVPAAAQCFALRTVDSVTTRGVPLVSLATSAGDTYVSDSQGFVAYCDPDFIGKSVTFTVTTDGYALAAGTSVTVAAVSGGARTIPLVRALPGQRLYRVTGQGIYRDSALLGMTMPLANPNINGLVMGQDTPSTFSYGGKVYWLWQDTSRAAYALGNFASSGATSLPAGGGGLSPDLGVDTTYFVGSDGFSRGMTSTVGDPLLTSGSSAPVWLGQPVSVPDPQGKAHVFGQYYVAASSKPWTALAEFDPATSTFDYVADFPAGTVIPAGRGIVVDGGADGAYVYWSDPVRYPATVEGLSTFGQHEVFSAYAPGSSTTLAHNADGTLAYSWQRGAAVVTHDALTAAHVAPDQELDGHLTDIVGGGGVQVANGSGDSAFGSSAMWNAYRQRFSEIIQQQEGATFLGESWYAEADTPLGPWVFARKVVTHATTGYTFYNPDVIPYLSEAEGRIVFFNATYTNSYSSAHATPRYNYNEMMYRIDLDDAEMALPVAVYARGSASASELVTKRGVRAGDPAMAPAFFAYDRAARGAVPVAWSGPSCGARRLTVGGQPATTPLFYALPPDAPGDAGAALPTIALYEYAGPGGAYVYSADPNFTLAGYQRGAVVARVWPTLIRVALPVADFLGDLVADGGADQCVSATGDAGGRVTLDASRTRDLAGSSVQYTWVSAENGCPIASGASADVVLPPGVHVVRLQATDALGNTSSDDVVVDVGP